jgi:hypothetical protein
MKEKWFFDYTHFNKTKDEQNRDSEQKATNINNTGEENGKDSDQLNSTYDDGVKKRKIKPKKPFYE